MMVEDIMINISVRKKLYVFYCKVYAQRMSDSGQIQVTKAFTRELKKTHEFKIKAVQGITGDLPRLFK